MSNFENYLQYKCNEIQQRLDEIEAPMTADIYRGPFGAPPSDIRLLDADGAIVGQLPDDADTVLALFPKKCSPQIAKAVIEAFAAGWDQGYEHAQKFSFPEDLSWS